MISPEVLRQYAFFRMLENEELHAIAMVAVEETVEGGTVLFQKEEAARYLYFLQQGRVELYYPVGSTSATNIEKSILVGEVNVGEPFSISAIIEPHLLSSTAYVARKSRLIKIDALELRHLFSTDLHMAYLLTYQAAKAAIERLYATRVQLAAAWA